MILTLWLPRVRAKIVSDWDVFSPIQLLSLVTDWKDLLPAVAYDNVVNQLVATKLSDAVRAWKPSASNSKHRSSAARPHTWLFPWLEHLDDYHLQPSSSNGVLAAVKRKFRTTFATWNPANGAIGGLDEWLEVKPLRRELKHAMEVNFLPRLAHYLHDHFQVDPSDQDITPIEALLKWQPHFTAERFGRVLLDAFFPKWLNVLHLWLTSEPNYEEVGSWFEWWQSQFPEEINDVPDIAAEWEKGLQMINKALDLGAAAKTQLARPAARTDIPPLGTEQKPTAAKPQTVPEPVAPITLRDVIEELCERESLLVIPLRKAHPENGLPLLRITASAAGTGGVTVYLRGDLVWAQSRKDRTVWGPVDIDALPLLAEGGR